MSRLNGDKSRFHRIRKLRATRRERMRKLREQLVAAKPAVADAAAAQNKAGAE